jgi:hypothetical protein
LRGGVHDAALRVVANSVAARENAERAALLQLQVELLQAAALGNEPPLDAHAETGRSLLEAERDTAETRAQVHGGQPLACDRKAAAGAVEPIAQTIGKLKNHVVGALPVAAKEILQFAQSAVNTQFVQPLAGVEK